MASSGKQLRQPVAAASAWWKRRHGDNLKDKPSWVDPAPLGDCDRTQTRKLVWVKTRAQPARRLEDGAWSPDAGDHDATWTVRAELVKCAGRPTLGQDGSSEKWGGETCHGVVICTRGDTRTPCSASLVLISLEVSLGAFTGAPRKTASPQFCGDGLTDLAR